MLFKRRFLKMALHIFCAQGPSIPAAFHLDNKKHLENKWQMIKTWNLNT